jgi:hypothetical protein
MLDDHKFNVLNQLSQESKSLWRIQNEYLPDAKEADETECVQFWERMAQDKQQHIEELSELLQKTMG